MNFTEVKPSPREIVLKERLDREDDNFQRDDLIGMTIIHHFYDTVLDIRVVFLV